MTAPPFRARPRRISVQAEEERAWVAFYQRAGKHPEIAAEVLAQLDLDPEMKREHLALYLCCREALRLQDIRAQRDQRIAATVRWMLGGVFVRLPRAVRRGIGRVGQIALACLPHQGQPQAEPAMSKVRRLAADPAVRAARAAFKAPPAAPAAATAAAPHPAPAADVVPVAKRAAG